MKSFKSKIAALLLAAAIILCSFALCSCEKLGDPLLIYGKTEITVNMYKFWLSRYKATFENQYGSSIKSEYSVSSVDDFWKLSYQDTDGTVTTYDDMFSEYIFENACTYLMALSLYNEYGLSLDKETTDEIDEYIDSLIEDFAGGSESEFNVVLAEYGINLDTLRACYEIDAKISKLQDYLYGTNGIKAITDADVEAYYQANYVRMEQVCIFLDMCPETGADGKYLTDDDGNIKYREMSAAETTLARQKAEEALSKLNLGSDFATVKAEYNENSESDSYTDGIYLSRDNAYSGGDDTTTLYDTLCDMKDGEFKLLELEHTIHIIYKLPLEEGAYNKSVNADFFSYYDSSVGDYVTLKKYIVTPLFLDFIDTKINENKDDILIDENLRKATKISTVKANYYF